MKKTPENRKKRINEERSRLLNYFMAKRTALSKWRAINKNNVPANVISMNKQLSHKIHRLRCMLKKDRVFLGDFASPFARLSLLKKS